MKSTGGKGKGLLFKIGFSEIALLIRWYEQRLEGDDKAAIGDLGGGGVNSGREDSEMSGYGLCSVCQTQSRLSKRKSLLQVNEEQKRGQAARSCKVLEAIRNFGFYLWRKGASGGLWAEEGHELP